MLYLTQTYYHIIQMMDEYLAASFVVVIALKERIKASRERHCLAILMKHGILNLPSDSKIKLLAFLSICSFQSSANFN